MRNVYARSLFPAIQRTIEGFECLHVADQLEETYAQPPVVLGRWNLNTGICLNASLKLLQESPALNVTDQVHAREPGLNLVCNVGLGIKHWQRENHSLI